MCTSASGYMVYIDDNLVHKSNNIFFFVAFCAKNIDQTSDRCTTFTSQTSSFVCVSAASANAKAVSSPDASAAPSRAVVVFDAPSRRCEP
jgi:hypothetical protein